MSNFIYSVANLCHVEEQQIAGLSQRKIVENYILPLAIKPTNQDIRGWRISPQFMSFMAKWGQHCVRLDRYTGELLLEIAMQRLSGGAIPHEIRSDADYEAAIAALTPQQGDSLGIKSQKLAERAKKQEEYMQQNADNLYSHYYCYFALPAEYRKYSNIRDQEGVMDQACWDFCRENLWFCMTELQNPIWCGHAQKLCAGLIQHLSCTGEPLCLWNEELIETHNTQEIYKFAEDCACRVFGYQRVAQILLPTWRDHKDFFKQNQIRLHFHNLFQGEGKNNPGLNYAEEAKQFGITPNRFTKFLRIFEQRVERKVLQEMMAE